MNLYNQHKEGQHVLFLDEHQCEIVGTIVAKHTLPDRLQLTIKLDEGGYYKAWLKYSKVVSGTSGICDDV